MADVEIPAAGQTLGSAGGSHEPYHVVTFDKYGACTSPRARDEVLASAAAATDVFVFSHGWNNDWAAANDRYSGFVEEYARLRERTWPEPERAYRPLPVGVFWPSTALVAPWERAPDIAGATAARVGLPEDLLAVGDALPPGAAERAYVLADRESLSPEEARELAGLLLPAVDGPEDELDLAGTSVEDLLAVWSALPQEDARAGESSEVGGFADDIGATVAEPAAAGMLDRLDPRKLVRLATVLLMKDRAGRVGARGVGDLLLGLNAAAPETRVHLVGHSYGGKVVLSALCAPPDPGPHVESVLLLQPAMSCYCFAAKVPGSKAAGGYAAALKRSRQPVVTTFSRRDAPLTRFFHWAVRRESDIGEAAIAGAPPSRYAALGGYGPQGRDADTVVVNPSAEPTLYRFAELGKPLVAIRADDVIHGHGDVANAATAWALLSQVRS